MLVLLLIFFLQSSAVAIKKSFLYMSLTSDLIDCAQWLVLPGSWYTEQLQVMLFIIRLMRKGVSFKENEPEKIAFMLLTDSSKRYSVES